MLKIADFARLTGVTPRLLRYYDQCGLFKPGHVDRATGYRYYYTGQVIPLQRILALRDLGLPLNDIAQILHDHLSLTEIAALLRLHQRRIEARLLVEQARQQEMTARLAALENPAAHALDVVIKPLLPFKGLHIQTTLQTGETIETLFNSFAQRLRERGLYPQVQATIGFYPRHIAMLTGQPLTEPYQFDALFVMARSPRAVPMESGRTLTAISLHPVTQAACALHVGPYQRLFETYRSLLAHLQQYGYTIVGVPRELYLQSRGTPDECITEIQIPVSRADQGVKLPLKVPA